MYRSVQLHSGNLEPLQPHSDFEDLRLCRHRLARISPARPDIMAATDIFSQVTTDTFNTSEIKKISKVIKHLKSTLDWKLRSDPINYEETRIVVYSDGSHVSNADSSSYLGYLVFITDGSTWHLIHGKNYKSRRIVCRHNDIAPDRRQTNHWIRTLNPPH